MCQSLQILFKLLTLNNFFLNQHFIIYPIYSTVFNETKFSLIMESTGKLDKLQFMQ